MLSGKKIYPPTYFNITILIIVLLHFTLPLVQIFYSYWRLIGVMPLISGILLNLLADASMKNSGTTVKPDEVSEALITAGVFRISRNPMYLGMVLIHIGICILLGSLTPFFVIPVFIYAVDRNFIKNEEYKLSNQFGEVWKEYKKNTRKWI